ncbi:MAG TPA: FAD-dependent oxidoreductase [Bacillota bacterium]|nr:FAD-dependent oxidoreductase [Bacillota bacterium]HOL09098.1 FAD-dependent oxidoreductase [Bacillota bacterium]HPO97155.1 FAD-dependent oxidoreductase [Bacillota bacterium]
MIYDIAIIGGGPAGLAAALNARRRNKNTILISKEALSSKLTQAHTIDNYPGLPEISGLELAMKLREHAESNGTNFIKDEIQNIYQEDQIFNLVGRESAVQSRTVVLATGVTLDSKLSGETDFIGKGVSYCATCDGMFFKGKPVAVIGYIREAEAETEFLAEICDKVYYLPMYKEPGLSNHKVEIVKGKPVAIVGQNRVEFLKTTVGDLPVAGVFIERAGRPVEQLLLGLEIEDGVIVTDNNQATNIEGVFAAGDCTGKPWQISRAIGQGQVAALSAVQYLERLKLTI